VEWETQYLKQKTQVRAKEQVITSVSLKYNEDLSKQTDYRRDNEQFYVAASLWIRVSTGTSTTIFTFIVLFLRPPEKLLG
jgi:hypothetical protein